jgi:hypothetical protein
VLVSVNVIDGDRVAAVLTAEYILVVVVTSPMLVTGLGPFATLVDVVGDLPRVSTLVKPGLNVLIVDSDVFLV